jgi:hypothetical protein
VDLGALVELRAIIDSDFVNQGLSRQLDLVTPFESLHRLLSHQSDEDTDDHDPYLRGQLSPIMHGLRLVYVHNVSGPETPRVLLSAKLTSLKLNVC